MGDLSVNLRILVVHLLLRDEVEVVGQVLLVPDVVLNFLQRDSFHGVGLQHQVYQVFHFVGDVVGDKVSALFDLAEQLGHLVVVEGQGPADHRVKDHTAAPDIYFGPTVAHAANNFWGGVVGRTASGLKGHGVPHNVGEAEINEPYVQIFIQEEVLRLEISMGYFILVRILYAGNYLLEYFAGLIF